MYKLLPNDVITGKPATCIYRVVDNTFIPMDEANVDYQQYLKWIADGNVAQPAENN
jgi:hypothetical protein